MTDAERVIAFLDKLDPFRATDTRIWRVGRIKITYDGASHFGITVPEEMADLRLESTKISSCFEFLEKLAECDPNVAKILADPAK